MTNISDAFVSGNRGELKSHVRITWLWLVFPFTLVAFSAMFVVVTYDSRDEVENFNSLKRVQCYVAVLWFRDFAE